jgi:hypothetical protein
VEGAFKLCQEGIWRQALILGLAVHYASQSFTISVLRLNDRQDWRDTPHIVIYVVLYPEIHIIYFRTRTHAYYSMSSALILLTYEIENLFIFFHNVMVAIRLVLHTVWVNGDSPSLGCCWLHLVSDPAKNILVVSVGSCTGQRYMTTTALCRAEPPTVTPTSSGHLLTPIIHRNHQVTSGSNHPLSDTSMVS